MSYNIDQADILAWAARYDGPLFHALLCDPPYHLTEITKRFGGDHAAPAQFGKDGAFNRLSKGFMGKQWDGGDIAFRSETWAALGRLLHPGAFLMAFAGTRGYHRMATAIEDAGFILHPVICWNFASGFPKATRISTQVDRAAGATPTVIGTRKHAPKWAAAEMGYREKDNGYNSKTRESFDVTAPATPLAQAWDGHRYGLQSLKPAIELICVAQKPYQGRPVESITRTGAGAINVDGGRIGTDEVVTERYEAYKGSAGIYNEYGSTLRHNGTGTSHPAGRWPSNLMLSHASIPYMRLTGNLPDGLMEAIRRYYHGYSSVQDGQSSGEFTSDGGRAALQAASGNRTRNVTTESRERPLEILARDIPTGWLEYFEYAGDVGCNGECHPACPVRRLGEQSGESTAKQSERGIVNIFDELYKRTPSWHGESTVRGHDDSGTAARFFFNADYALDRLEQSDPLIYVPKSSTAEREAGLIDFDLMRRTDGRAREHETGHLRTSARRNIHPTLKPLSLARHLATLLLPPDLYAPRRLLIPFAGAGSEMIGAMLAGWEVVQGIELEAEHVAIARARIAFWKQMRYKLMNPDTPVKVTSAPAIPDGQATLWENDNG